MPVFASTTASGGGAGTVGDPYTLKEACAAVNANDTVYCRGGDYTGIRGDSGSNDPFVDLTSGTSTNRTLIRPYENEVVNLYPTLDYSQLLRMPTDSTRIRFQDIIFNGNASATTPQAMVTGFSGDTTAYWEFLNCTFQNTRGVCVQTSGTTDMKFQGCSWLNQRMAGAIGSYCVYVNGGSHRCEISGSVMDGNESFVIHHYSTSGESDDCRYFNNTVKDWGGIEGSAILLSNGDGNWAYNNLFMNARSNTSGVFEIDWNPASARNTRNAIIAYNAAYNIPGPFARLGQTAASPNIFLNNIAIDVTTPVVTGGEQTPTYTTNLWQIDSGATAAETWVDPGVDFQLKSGSPALGVGTHNANFTTDRLGNTRNASTPDLGPYELGTSSAPINTLPSTLTTQVNVAISFASADVSHGGDLDRVILYPESGTLS